MSKIFEAAGDVVDDTVDFVTDNKEIIAAITLAYMTGGASTTATATTAEATALTAEAIAAEEAARIAAMEASKQAAMAETIAAAKTSGEITIKFQVNVNQAGSMETWSTLKAWYDLVFNSQDGTMHYKSDIIGTIIVNQHDKKGVVLRRVTFQNVQIKKIAGYSLDWSTNGTIETCQADFIWDYFIDEYIDPPFGVSPPMIPGY